MVFVYEFTCATDTAPSLQAEGWAMLSAVVDDLARIEGVRVATLLAESFVSATKIDAEIVRSNNEEESNFRRLASHADATLVIAPEFDRILEDRCRWTIEAGGTWLGCPLETIRLTSDKLALFQQFKEHHVPTPETILLSKLSVAEVAFPIIIKRRDGAGSLSMQVIRDTVELSDLAAQDGYLAQPFVAGLPCSLSFLVGPRQTVPLVPSLQRLGDDLSYHGGEISLPPDLATRVTRLAEQAVCSVEGLGGYVGVDLVLGVDGHDYAIEINPRLTTSYVGLRKLARTNLAEAMLKILSGKPVESLPWLSDRVRFFPDGRTERVAQGDSVSSP